MQNTTHTGRCLCESVTFRIEGPLEDVTACHCSQCRRNSGHHAAMTAAPNGAVTVDSPADLRWFKSSDFAERGFCGVCGSNLFWRELAGHRTSITAGSLDIPTDLKIGRHIFVADKGDYYAIEDGAPQSQQG
jgi:hypothetical protein